MTTVNPSLQLFPGLDAPTVAALRASIKANGLIYPVVVDQHGRIIDGNHRSAICAQEGIECRTITVDVEDDDHARELARTTNADRRQLDAEERRRYVAVLRSEGHSMRAIAGALGVSPATVLRDTSGVSDETPEVSAGSDDGVEIDAGDAPPTSFLDELSSNDPPRPVPSSSPVPAPAPRITGRDGKSYPATSAGSPARARPDRRSSLPDQAQRLGSDLRRWAEHGAKLFGKLDKIVEDDRFTPGGSTATALRPNLHWAVEALQEVPVPVERLQEVFNLCKPAAAADPAEHRRSEADAEASDAVEADTDDVEAVAG